MKPIRNRILQAITAIFLIRTIEDVFLLELLALDIG
jgi:hypothetical protein